MLIFINHFVCWQEFSDIVLIVIKSVIPKGRERG